jgi:hypothetical protein
LPEPVVEGEDQYELRPGVLKGLERLKWYLWHSNVFQALQELQGLEMNLDAAAFEAKDEHARKLYLRVFGYPCTHILPAKPLRGRLENLNSRPRPPVHQRLNVVMLN